MSGVVRRFLSVAAVLAATIGGVPPAAATSSGAAAVCRAVNVRSGQASSSLQVILDTAVAGDHLHVSGTCAGGFSIRRSVTLTGVSTAAAPRPTLTGRDRERVVVVRASDAARVVLDGLLIRDGFSDAHGGGILNRTGAELVLRDVALVDSSANKGGALFSRGSTSVRVSDSRVRANTATRGAGLYVRGGEGQIVDLHITDNVAKVGGGVFVRSGQYAVRGATTLSANRGSRGGGAIFLRGGSVTLEDRASLEANRAGRGGAVLTRGHLELQDNARILDNTARRNGGGVFGYAPASVLVQDTVLVKGNSAGISGGGAAMFGGRLDASGAARFVVNDARNGGALASLGDVAEIVVRGRAALFGNQARNGGAIAFGGPVTLRGKSRVTSNEAKNGGGVWDSCRELCHGTVVRVEGHASVSGNVATSEGGGINSGRGGVRLRGHASVTDNRATNGGGVFEYSGGDVDRHGDVIVEDDARIASNTASEDGGGVYSNYNGSRILLLDHGSIRRNTAIDGGGVFSNYVRMYGSSAIAGNIALDRGGGIAAFGGGGRTRIGREAVISRNQAQASGGGIFTWGGPTQGGHVWLEVSAQVTANTAATGAGVYVDSGWVLALADVASITANEATSTGGGIENLGTVTFDDGWLGTVCGNTPDDWPGCS